MTAVPRFGPRITDSGVTFRLWAPAAQTVTLHLDGRKLPMTASAGWHVIDVPSVSTGARYSFVTDGANEVPDPASHFQPNDVHGQSEVIDHQFDWQARDWRGRPWKECVFLELHVGTFTSEGTFRAIIDRLDDIASNGITAIELMPVADFPGRWNWGYDGVLQYAPDSRYGRPEDLKALVDAAHQRGLMVFLDVVYNHFGPDGNYIGGYAPGFFTEAQTPWGSAIDYDVREVRDFTIENALHWLRDYRFDGLRLDAVHAIVRPGEPEVLHELSESVAELAKHEGREIHLVLENDDNRAAWLDPAGAPGKYRAQWNDDFHHAFHVLLTGETAGYYGDYREAGVAIARALAEGFVYQGEASPHREGIKRGEVSATLPPTAFVNFLQNHDQIGNRARGERLSALAPAAAVECALTILLLSPPPPLLFMGEEWGTQKPFPFFCDFSGDLADAVRAGRKKEFAAAYAESDDDIPDPLAQAAVASATLDWKERAQSPYRERLALVRELLAIRRDRIVPLIDGLQPPASASFTDGVIDARWPGKPGGLRIVANLSPEPKPAPPAIPGETLIWGTADTSLPPWSAQAFLWQRR